MADTLSNVYKFVLPEPGGSDDTWGLKLNQDWGTLDALLASAFTPPADASVLGNLKSTSMPALITNQRLQDPYIEPSLADADGGVLMEFRFARAWKLLQKGAGSNANLELQAQVGGKSFYISNSDRTKGFHFDPDTGIFDVFGNTDLKVNSYLGTTARFTGAVYGQIVHSNGYFYIKDYASDPLTGAPVGGARANYDSPTKTINWVADTGPSAVSLIHRISNIVLYGAGMASVGKVLINSLPDGTLADTYISATATNPLRLRSGTGTVSVLDVDGNLIGHLELAGSASTSDGDTIMTRQKCDARYVRS